MRQNQRANQPLFDACDSDMTMVPSEVVANECLALAYTPLLGRLIDVVLERDESLAEELTKRVLKRTGAAQWPMLRNSIVVEYVLTGVDPQGGWLWRALRRGASGKSTSTAK